MTTVKIHLVAQDDINFTTLGYITFETNDIKETAMTINRVLSLSDLPGRIDQFSERRNEFALRALPHLMSIAPYHTPGNCQVLVDAIKTNLPVGVTISAHSISILEVGNPNMIFHYDDPLGPMVPDAADWVFPPSAPVSTGSLFAAVEEKETIDELEEKDVGIGRHLGLS